MTVTETLADFLLRPVNVKDRDRAAILLLDWTACAVAGQSEAAGRKVAAAFPNESGQCKRIGAGSASPQMAALHNGCLGNILEMDDVDKRAVLHAAPTVIPAALALAEQTGASFERFLDAIIIGYEATIRLGRAVGPGHYAYWHNTATCGPIGAASAACHLLEGSDLTSALGLAMTQSAGLWQTRHEPDSMAKQLHAGHAAQVGVQSALLSAQGFQGPRSILEGQQGFFAAMCPGANPKDILHDYGPEWLIHQTSIKPYPACRHAHAAIDAALLARESGVKTDGDIVVETYLDALKFCDKANPNTVIESKFSLQHSVAVALLKGEPTLADFDPSNMGRDIVELRQRVYVKAVDAFNQAYPNHYGAALKIGKETFVSKNAYGDPEKPMREAAVRAKAIMLMTHGGMSGPEAKWLCDATLSHDFSAYRTALP